MKIVLHLVRKCLPATASFIRNQVISHQKYAGYIGYAEDVASVLHDEVTKTLPDKNVAQSYFGEMAYRYLRILSRDSKNRLIQYIGQVRPDIIHIHYGVDALVFLEALSGFDIPIVVSFYGYDCTLFPKSYFGLGKYLLQKKVFNNDKVRRVLAMSPDMLEDLVSIGCPRSKIVLHYYGTDVNRFFIKREYQEKAKVNFLIISGLAEKKGHLFLLRSFLSASEKAGESLHLTIVGDGEMKGSIEAFVSTNRMRNVTIVNRIAYGSTAHIDYLNNADVFIHPSVTSGSGDKEGIPGAIVEAMASGLPVLSTEHAGIPYIIENNKTGILVKENDVESLSTEIIRIAKNASLRQTIGTAAQKYAFENLNLDIKELELENLYDELLGEKK
jgi:colanic acid/amylovoran biosynthesis glycosyltransferase